MKQWSIDMERPTPDMIESHYMNNFGGPLISSLLLREGLNKREGNNFGDQNVRRTVLGITSKTYSQFWDQELGVLLKNQDKRVRHKHALLQRYKEVQVEIAPKIDSIIQQMRQIALNDLMDFRLLEVLLKEFNSLRPEDRRDSE
jgi:hypothetical protein